MMRFSTLAVAVAIAPLAFAQDESIEEVVVTSSLVHSSLTATTFIVSGDSIAESGSQAIGEHLSTLAGVSSNNFGPAVGQPVIRGMSGNRVKLLQNGLVIRDASGIGPDHANDVDLNNVQQIEVVRGASALLYSNGASGGIINIVDNTIARSDVEEASAYVGAESQSVNDGSGFSAGARGNVGGFNLSYDYSEFDADSFDIPRGSIIHDEEHDEDHEEEHDDHHEEHDEDMTTLADSDYETEAHRFGISRAGDWGYVGASYQELSSTYGIPFHGEHGGHEEEHEGEEHEGEDHEGEEHEEHGEERIISQTDSEILTLEGQLNLNGNLLKNVRFSVRDTDYLLSENHAEGDEHEGEEHEDEDHDEHGHSEEPTFFSNESTEVQLVFELGTDEEPRRVVVNHVSEEVAVLGEEAFMEPVDSTETTIGFFAGFNTGGFDIDVGARWDDIERDGVIREMHHEEEHEGEHEEGEDHDEGEHHDEHGEEAFELEPFTYSDQSVSAAVTISRQLSDSLNASLNLGVVNRAPSAMELFMNGEHLAVARYELGDANLDSERSNNIDLGLSYAADDWFANVSVYRNRVDNYIYLQDEMDDDHDHEEEHDEDHEEDHEEGHEEGHDEHDHEGLLMASYVQNDATFSGYEIELGRRFALAGGELEVRLQRDEVNADFSGGGDVPRITPARNVLAFDYSRGMTSALLEIQDIERQSAVADFETTTDGFTLVNARLSHSVELGERAVLVISAYGRNLTDEVARNHTSFVKNEVPLAGRNIGIRARLSF